MIEYEVHINYKIGVIIDFTGQIIIIDGTVLPDVMSISRLPSMWISILLPESKK